MVRIEGGSEYELTRAFLGESAGRLIRLLFVGIILASCTAIYGAMAGPILKLSIARGEIDMPSWLQVFGIAESQNQASFFTVIMPLIVGAAVAKGVFSYLFLVERTQFGHRVSRYLREDLFARIERGGLDEIESVGKGDLVARFIYDIELVERMFSDGIVRSGQALIEVVLLFLLCLSLDWQLAALFFLIYPIVLIPLLRITRQLKRESKSSQEAIAATANIVQEQLHANKVIQSLHYPGILRQRLNSAIENVYASSLRAVKLKAVSSPIAEVMGACALCLTVGVCIWRLTGDSGSGENSLSFIACLLLMYRPIKQIGELPQLLAPGRAALSRIATLPLGSGGASGTQSMEASKGITLDNLGVKRGGKWVFRQLTCHLDFGQLVLISGRNGSGKSSLIDVLLGLREASEGTVLFGGVSSADAHLASWRAQIGWLTQDSLLLEGSLLDNILMGRECYRIADVYETWQRLGFEIEGSPETFFSRKLKPEGTGLSGGERRKLLMTRACIGEPPILILDEPDAFQDVPGKQAIDSLIESLRGRCLVIVVSHDESLKTKVDLHLELTSGWEE
ncbi:MAG: ABC transporter transmembrane domain-containing protein [Bradymonadia bacterium]